MATASLAFREYKRFLLLLALIREGEENSVKFMASHLVSLMWEYHAIETQEYSQFCLRIFGRVIPVAHYEMKPSLQADYASTIDAYTLVFKHEPPASIWETPASRFRKRMTSRFYNPRAAVECLF